MDKSLGALLISTWGNSILYALEVGAVIKYFKNHSRDHYLMKATVLLTLAIDTLSTIGNYAGVYMYTITHWGDLEFLQNQYWPIPVYLITTGSSAFIVQMYLIHRYFRLAKHYVVCICLFSTALVGYGGAWATAITIIQFPGYAVRYKVQIPVTVWLISSAVADTFIALALIYQLRTVKTAFKSTKSLLNRLIASTISTGSATGIVALIALVVYLQDPEGNISVGFAECLGRIYALTMLYNLNSRKSERKDNSHSGGTHHNTDDAVSMGGIHVQQTAFSVVEYSGNPDIAASKQNVELSEDTESFSGKRAHFGEP